MRILVVLILLWVPAAFAQDEDRETFYERLTRYHAIVQAMVQGSLDSRGLSIDTLFRPNLASYNSIASDIDDQIKKSNCIAIECDGYLADLAKIVQSEQSETDFTKILPNKDSFEVREKLFRFARKSIYILAWAVYDDETGKAFRDQLLDAVKANPQLEVRIIVDGNIVNLKGRRVLSALEDESLGQIKIMRWKSRIYRANGNHRKLIVVDGEHVIIGGMNIGNNYSHISTKNKWRDLDIYIHGEKSAALAINQFADVWNRQIIEFPKLKDEYRILPYAELTGISQGAPVIFVDQHPGSAAKDAYHHIHTAVIKLFRDAKKSIDIENAYFIMDPIIKKELAEVIKRGVEVRIFTNSDKSVDEAIVSAPVMHSARLAVEMGAKVYLKQGSTLHSKFMVVDERISMVGSFNFHPRSLRFDAENVAIIDDIKTATELTQHFEAGIQEARFYDNHRRLHINWDLLGILTQSFYFDFL